MANKNARPSRGLSITLNALAALTITFAGSTARADQPAYVGVGSCSASTCHGSVSPRKGSDIAQNEYAVWEKHDKHAKAWLNLLNEDSKRIAFNMGMGAPEKEPLCLSCHSTPLTPSDRLGANFRVEDGVSCESCHGAAENYLGSHTANDATHKGNVERGLRELVPVTARASFCLTCHHGSEDKYVNHKLIGAGHPRLSFELDTFSQIQPKHWNVDEDYIKRKADYSPVQAWLTGQFTAANQIVSTLGSDKLAMNGRMPELTNFYCFSCHHSLTEEQWKVRNYHGKPGELKLNMSALLIVQQALKAIDTGASNSIGEAVALAHSGYTQGNKGDLSKAKALLAKAKDSVDRADLGNKQTSKMLANLLQFCAEDAGLQYEDAEQLAMGVSAIVAAKSPDGSLYKNEIDNLYQTLSDPKAFLPAPFSQSCRVFQSKLKA